MDFTAFAFQIYEIPKGFWGKKGDFVQKAAKNRKNLVAGPFETEYDDALRIEHPGFRPTNFSSENLPKPA